MLIPISLSEGPIYLLIMLTQLHLSLFWHHVLNMGITLSFACALRITTCSTLSNYDGYLQIGYLVVIFNSLIALCLQYNNERSRDTSLSLYDMSNLLE